MDQVYEYVAGESDVGMVAIQCIKVQVSWVCDLTCIADGSFPGGLHNDLHFLGAVGLHESAAWSHAVFLGAGGLHLESNTLLAGVCELHHYRDVLSQLKPAVIRAKDVDTMIFLFI